MELQQKTALLGGTQKKEMTLDCPSIDASRVISLGSWVQSLVNLLFCGLVRLSVTKFELLLATSFSDYTHLPSKEESQTEVVFENQIYERYRRFYLYIGITSCDYKVT